METSQKNQETKEVAQGKAEYQLKDLFETGLNDIYSAEKALIETLPHMVENASSPELTNTLQNHLAQTKENVSRLEEIFEAKGITAVAKKSEAIEGLIEESKSLIAKTEIGAIRDAGIIATGQKLKKYEIATYDALHSFAENLGENKAANLLKMTLNEHKKANAALNEIAQSNASEQI